MFDTNYSRKGYVTGACLGAILGAVTAIYLKNHKGKNISRKFLSHLNMEKVMREVKSTKSKVKRKVKSKIKNRIKLKVRRASTRTRRNKLKNAA